MVPFGIRPGKLGINGEQNDSQVGEILAVSYQHSFLKLPRRHVGTNKNENFYFQGKVSLDHFEPNMYIPTSNPRDEGIDIDSLDDGETVWPFTSFATL